MLFLAIELKFIVHVSNKSEIYRERSLYLTMSHKYILVRRVFQLTQSLCRV
jgi:hypothetical protein